MSKSIPQKIEGTNFYLLNESVEVKIVEQLNPELDKRLTKKYLENQTKTR